MPAQSRGAGRGGIEPRRDAEHEVLVHDDAAGVAAQGVAAQHRIVAVVGEHGRTQAVLLLAGEAGRALAARIHHAADAGHVACLELPDAAADARHASDDLVAGHAGVEGALPLAPRLVEVGVAHPAIEDVDLDVARSGITAVDLDLRKR